MSGFDQVYDALSGVGSAHAFAPVRFNGGDAQNATAIPTTVLDRLDGMYPNFGSFGLIVSVRCPESGCEVVAGLQHSSDGVVWETLLPVATVIVVEAAAAYLGGMAQVQTSIAGAKRYIRAAVTVTIDAEETEDVDCHGLLLIGGAIAPARTPD